MFKYGTKCFNTMLGSLDIAFANGIIELRTGAQPTSPDDAATGVLIGKVTKNGDAFVAGSPGNGLNFSSPALNVLSKDPAEVWKMTAVAVGTIGYGRLLGNAADDGSARTDLPRIDFSVGLTSGDARTSKLNYAINEVGTIDSFTITQTNI